MTIIELKQKLIDAGYAEMINSKNDGFYFNSADSHYITEQDNKIKLETIGGSRYSYPNRYTVDEAFAILDKYASKTSKDIDKEYRAIFTEITK